MRVFHHASPVHELEMRLSASEIAGKLLEGRCGFDGGKFGKRLHDDHPRAADAGRWLVEAIVFAFSHSETSRRL